MRQLFYQRIGPFDLVFCGGCAFSIGYYADSYSLVQTGPSPAGDYRRLSLPSFSGEHLPVACSVSIADEEMTIEIFGFGQPIHRCQLLDIAGVGSAEIDLYALPSLGLLRDLRTDGFCDWVEADVACKAEWSCERRPSAESHQDYGSGCHRDKQGDQHLNNSWLIRHIPIQANDTRTRA